MLTLGTLGVCGCREGSAPAGGSPNSVPGPAVTATAQTVPPRPRAACASADGGCFRLLQARMVSPRLFTAATTLPDGRVFIAGGASRAGIPFRVKSTELFDPRTETFTAGPEMAYPRSAHSQTLLQDGRVLIVGGDDAGSAEIFDPRANKISAPVRMSEARMFHSATLLDDGRVVVAGGRTPKGKALDSCEVFNAAKQVFSAGPELPEKKWAHAAVVLKGGELLIAGGAPDGDTALLMTTQPAWMVRAVAARMAKSREDHRGTLLADGRVPLVGGSDGPSTDSAEYYDPASGRFSPAAARMQVRREDQSLTQLADGRVLIAGGEDNAAGPNATDLVHRTADLFDPARGEFIDLGNLAETFGRDDHGAARLNDGRVLLFGGEDKDGIGIATAEIFDPAIVK